MAASDTGRSDLGLRAVEQLRENPGQVCTAALDELGAVMVHDGWRESGSLFVPAHAGRGGVSKYSCECTKVKLPPSPVAQGATAGPPVWPGLGLCHASGTSLSQGLAIDPADSQQRDKPQHNSLCLTIMTIV